MFASEMPLFESEQEKPAIDPADFVSWPLALQTTERIGFGSTKHVPQPPLAKWLCEPETPLSCHQPCPVTLSAARVRPADEGESKGPEDLSAQGFSLAQILGNMATFYSYLSAIMGSTFIAL